MPERIRFHLDEHMDPDIAEALRRHGIDVTTTNEAGLRTSADIAQIAFLREQRRVIVTDDTDFLRFAAESTNHPGIVYCPRRVLTIGQIIRGLILIYEVLTPDELRGRVEFL